MKIKTYLAKLNVCIGEYENIVTLLIVSNSYESAEALLEDSASQYYGDGKAPKEDEGYYANNGEVHVKAHSLNEIGLTTFLDLKRIIRVRCADNVNMPTEADLDESVRAAAKPLLNALLQKAPQLGQSDVLNALASSWGQKNWQVLKSKIESPSRKRLDALVQAARDVVMSTDDEGCTEDLTVTSKEAVEALDEALDALDEAAETSDAQEAVPQATAIREDVVADLVEDVRERARSHGFSVSGVLQAKELVVSSNDVLSLDATADEIDEAARRIA